MKWLTIITISLLLFGCNSEEEPFAGIVVGKKYIPPEVKIMYNPVLKIMMQSHQECKYVIYAANSKGLKTFEVEKDIFENTVLCDSLYMGVKK